MSYWHLHFNPMPMSWLKKAKYLGCTVKKKGHAQEHYTSEITCEHKEDEIYQEVERQVKMILHFCASLIILALVTLIFILFS